MVVLQTEATGGDYNQHYVDKTNDIPNSDGTMSGPVRHRYEANEQGKSCHRDIAPATRYSERVG